jgi:rfaE bifunctional protein kinase chain/domain
VNRVEISSSEFLRSVQSFGSIRVAVIGDVMLDIWLEGSVRRISQEAPIPVVELTGRKESPGGAANVAELLASLGATVSLLGVVGQDDEASALREAVRSTNITARFVGDAGRPTTTKTRVISGTQQICRLDVEDRSPAVPSVESEMIEAVPEALDGADAVIISDYGKGALTGKIVEAILSRTLTGEQPTVVDPNGSDATRYSRSTILKPNRHEAFRALQLPFDQRTSTPKLAEELKKMLDGCAVLVTDGANGMTLADEAGTYEIPAIGHAVVDVAGAGDAVSAMLALSLAAGHELAMAAYCGNVAGAAAVLKRGTEPIGISDLVSVLEKSSTSVKDMPQI